MSDIVERLRAGICDDPCRVRDIPSGCACAEAAARIEQLEDAVLRGNKTWNALSDQCDAKDAHIERLEAALEVCDRVLHFDLRGMITWGKDYNQAVKDAADAARAALEERT